MAPSRVNYKSSSYASDFSPDFDRSQKDGSEFPNSNMDNYFDDSINSVNDIQTDGASCETSVQSLIDVPDGKDEVEHPSKPQLAEASSNSQLNYEENRLRTFSNWPEIAPIDKKKLAKAGFYYTGVRTRVKCFSCQGEIEEWHFNDSPMQKHQTMNRNCLFVLKQSNNIAMQSVRYDHRIPTESEPISSMSSLNPIYSSTPQSLPSSVLTTTSGCQDKTWQNLTSLVSEKERLNTYNGWPCAYVKPEDLARAGFFYLKESDKVRCIFCNGVVGAWEPGDVPITEHHRHFPACPFIRGFNVGNIPIVNGIVSNGCNSQFEEMLHNPDRTWNGDVTGRFKYEMEMFTRPEKSSNTISKLYQLGINQHSAPVHPSFATYEARLRTFNGWPKNLVQTKESMADAGFYYAGVSDHVRCFSCDGGLRNWEPNDQPWVEHARWFGKCNFLLIVKGREFIERAAMQYPPIISKPGCSKQPQPQTKDDICTQVNRLIRTQIVQAVIEVGVDVGAVRRAIIRRLRDVGTPFPDSDTLYESCLEEDVSISEEELLRNCPESMVVEPPEQLIARSPSLEPEESLEPAEAMAAGLTKLSVSKPNGIISPTSSSPVSMEEENRQLKEMRLCKICLDNEVGVVFLPCGHLVCCPQCAPSLKDCPMCRKTIQGTVRTFLA